MHSKSFWLSITGKWCIWKKNLKCQKMQHFVIRYICFRLIIDDNFILRFVVTVISLLIQLLNQSVKMTTQMDDFWCANFHKIPVRFYTYNAHPWILSNIFVKRAKHFYNRCKFIRLMCRIMLCANMYWSLNNYSRLFILSEFYDIVWSVCDLQNIYDNE